MTRLLEKPRRLVEQPYPNQAPTLRHVLPYMFALLVSPLVLCACPAFESEYSGTYVEKRDDSRQEELMVIDFHRFGDYANAIVREYRVPQSAGSSTQTQNGTQLFCSWSELGVAPNEDTSTWELEVEASTRTGMVLSGKFIDRETIEVTITGGQGFDETQQVVTKLFERQSTEPNNECDAIRPYFIEPYFQLGTGPNTFPNGSSHRLRDPLFGLLWLGVEPIQGNGVVNWGAKNELTSTIFLKPGNILAGRNGLQDQLSQSVFVPSDRALSTSGDTRYGLAHFVIIDDECGSSDEACEPLDNARAWDRESKPIVATALQPGNEVDSPFKEATGLGRALLFVEGKLTDLHPEMQKIIKNLDAYVDTRDSAHFYIVDVFYNGRDVLGLRLPEDPETLTSLSYRQVTMKMTDDYLLNAEALPPRLIPRDLLQQQ